MDRSERGSVVQEKQKTVINSEPATTAPVLAESSTSNLDVAGVMAKPTMARGKRKTAAKKPAWDDDEDEDDVKPVVKKAAPVPAPVAAPTPPPMEQFKPPQAT